MKRLFTMLTWGLCSVFLVAQDTESYTALKVTGNNVPVIDGNIDAVWEVVETVALTKVPEEGGVVHANITVPNPDPSDYSAEIGMLWNDDGIFFIFSVTDDQVVIVDDYYTDNDIPADQWWYDDNINILFSKDLENIVFTQWEFAWQPGIDQEEKLSSDDWANPALIDISLVQSAWYNDGNLWVLETFIDWEAFADGNPLITEGMDIFLEARARDDDDNFQGSSWESMFQWSTVNYQVESDGIGMGTVTLSADEIEGVGTGTRRGMDPAMQLWPNYSTGTSELRLKLSSPGDVHIRLCDTGGRQVGSHTFEGRSSGDQVLPLDFSGLKPGIYFVQVRTATESTLLKFLRQ